MVTGQPLRSAPVVMSSACSFQVATLPSQLFAMTYAVPVAASTTGVLVMPIFGERSLHGSAVAGSGAPTFFDQIGAPVVGDNQHHPVGHQRLGVDVAVQLLAEKLAE